MLDVEDTPNQTNKQTAQQRDIDLQPQTPPYDPGHTYGPKARTGYYPSKPMGRYVRYDTRTSVYPLWTSGIQLWES